MKHVHALFFDEESTVGEMVQFYGEVVLMAAVGLGTLSIVSPDMMKLTLICLVLLFIAVWIIGKKAKKEDIIQQNNV